MCREAKGQDLSFRHFISPLIGLSRLYYLTPCLLSKAEISSQALNRPNK